MTEVDLRNLWKHEANDFTPWLAKPENLEALGNEIGLTLTNPQTEHNVGRFSCDIVCKDEFTQKTVIIENQLESTDHDHLGKIITYASGLNASCIVWIVREALPEHASAIEWLNSHTDENVSFFLIEIKAWKIGDSDPAPQFTMIEKPNDFSKNMKKTVSGEMNDSQKSRLEFWENFNKVLKARREFNVRKATTDHWYNFAIGSSLCQLQADLVNREGYIRVGLWIHNDKKFYDQLFDDRQTIEDKLAEMKLEWFKEEKIKASGITMRIDGLDFDENGNYDDLANKIIDIAVRFKSVFQPIVKKYRPNE